MEAFKRLENEDENAYIWRVCDNKDLIGTWQDVCNLLNEELHHDYNESWYRKMYQSFMMVFDSIKDKYFDNEQLNKMEQKKQEIIKERFRLNDERTAYNRALRNDARLETRLDILEQKITDFGKINFPDSNYSDNNTADNDLLVLLSDLHIGQTFKSFNGEYNTKIAQIRMGQYVNKIIEIGKKNNSDKCYVSLQGDLISNSIHKSIAITNQENVIQQIKFASELITAFIYELSHHFNRVIVTSVSGNHSRLDKKEDALKDERLDDLVIWYMDAALNDVKNIDIITNNPDTTFAVMDIRGKKYVNVHGDYDAFSKNGVASLSMMLGYFPYAITFGHLHTCAMSDEGGIKIIRGGSLAGSGDDYTIEKRLTGKASQMVCVCTDKGVESYNIIELE
jgi:hypothetical protein